MYKFLSAIVESYVQEVQLMNYESSVPKDLIFYSVFCMQPLERHEKYMGFAIIFQLFEKNSAFERVHILSFVK